MTTRGIVGQVTASAVVCDAETSQGGSGGPVLRADGRVVAVNRGVMPEFGGSNLGVPVRRVSGLLRRAGIDRQGGGASTSLPRRPPVREGAAAPPSGPA